MSRNEDSGLYILYAAIPPLTCAPPRPVLDITFPPCKRPALPALPTRSRRGGLAPPRGTLLNPCEFPESICVPPAALHHATQHQPPARAVALTRRCYLPCCAGPHASPLRPLPMILSAIDTYALSCARWRAARQLGRW